MKIVSFKRYNNSNWVKKKKGQKDKNYIKFKIRFKTCCTYRKYEMGN